MPARPSIRQWLRRSIAVLLGVGGVVVVAKGLSALRRVLPDNASGGVAAPMAPAATPEGADGGRGEDRLAIPDSLLGRSGALRFATLTAAEAQGMAGFLGAFGDTSLSQPAALPGSAAGLPFTLLVLRPFSDKRGEMLGWYRLGWWPSERWMMASNYLNPDGFVEVYPQHLALPLSAHFALGEFLTHDQLDTWPKYLVLEERLIDKLELVLAELRSRRVGAGRAVVLSGFRAPYYNEQRIDEGAAPASRHQYGDAADIVIDDDGDGRMDDLNGDGRSDLRDVRPIGDAVAAVERRYPELTGGLGTYAAMGPSGPFAHVDVRGTRARWKR